MKKVLQILGGISASFILAIAGASTAFAQTNDCTIINTGPGSVNECEVINEETCEANNGTFVEIDNDNEQNSGSGDASGDGATSGNSNNTNETNIEIDVENGTCVFAAPVTPETPETPVTPETPSTPQVLPAQTVAPVGGVGAGSGGTAPIIFSLSILCLALVFAGTSRILTQKF